MGAVQGGVARRLVAAFAALLGFLLLGGAGGVAAVMVSTGATTDLAQVLQPEAEANQALLQLMTDAESGLRGYQLSGDRRFLASYQASLSRFPVQVEQLRRFAQGNTVDLRLVDQQEQAGRRWLDQFGIPVSTGPGGPGSVSPTLDAQGRQWFEEFRAANAATSTDLAKERAARLADAARLRALSLAATIAFTGVALVVGILTASRTGRAVAGPLAALRTTLARLAAGEHEARAPVVGPVEVAAVAVSVNTLADEGDRLRAAAAERLRLEQLAREVGRRIRDHLDQPRIAAEAVRALGEALAPDVAYVRLLDGADLGPVRQVWTAPGQEPVLGGALSVDGVRPWLAALHESGTSLVVDDVTTEPLLAGPEGRALCARTGAGALLVTPLAEGGECVGLVVLVQRGRPRHWQPAEVHLVESVAADVGRGLLHARLFARQAELVRQLQELDRAKSDFLATVSHELRTPLTSIAGYAELLAEGEAGRVTASQRQMLQVIVRNSDRLRVLIEDLLTLGRIEGGSFRTTRAPVDLRDVVAGAVQALRPQAGAGGVSLEATDPAPLSGPVVVTGDAGQLERVVLNLLSNAVKFTPAGGRVRLGLRVEGDRAVLEVADSGIGIPPEEQERLFTRFFRASNATEAAIQGTGLGLTIVRSILVPHGGDLAVASAPGEGTTVTVKLPLAGAAADGPALAAGSGILGG